MTPSVTVSAMSQPNDLSSYYADHYDCVVYSGAGGAVQRQFHRALERPWPKGNFENVLELGATNAEHLDYVCHHFQRYTMLDINDSSSAREAALAASKPGRPVEFVVGDAQTLDNIPDGSVDRLISMCLLHHLPDPDGALARWRAVVKPGGVLSIFLPCDPGLTWRSGRLLTTFRAAKKLGMSDTQIRYLNARDHRNHFASLAAMIDGVFADDQVVVKRFPLPFLPSWNANLYCTYHITRGPDRT